MTIEIDLDQLEATAKEASQGLWEVNEGDDEITLDKGTALTRWNEDGTVGFPARSWHTIDRIVEVDPEELTQYEAEKFVADLQHIAAARPEVVLALIDRLRTAEARVSDRLEYTIVAESSNGALSSLLSDYTTVVREHLDSLLETYRADEERMGGNPDRIFIAERPIPKWVRS